MMARLVSFPDTARIEVAPAVASQLLSGAERLPRFDNEEFYSPELQLLVRDQVRQASPDGFDDLVGKIAESIARWPFCVLISGLSFDVGNKVFVAINRAFGELVARPFEKPRAQLVHYVEPATDLPSARGGHESERLHTDTADWEPPVELISMVCVRADHKGGGRSRILDVETIRDEVGRHLGSTTLQRLESEPVPWQLAPYLGGGLKWRPVLTGTSVCWRRYTINLALESENISLSEEMLSTLDAFEKVITATERTLDFLMRESELLFSDNHRTIHARTPIPDAIASERLMIRSWIRTTSEVN
jgi:hypothetical protein